MSTTLALAGLAPGTYVLQARVETPAGTFEADGGAWWSFTVGVVVAADHWRGDYFSNMALEGPPCLVRDDGTGMLAFDWGSGGGGGGAGSRRHARAGVRT